MLKNLFVTVLILILLGVSVFVGYNTFRSKEKYTDFNGTQRRYRVHLPSDYDESESYPLVVAFHGLLENPRFFELITGWSRKADSEDFIVVYPYGTKDGFLTPYSWNAKFCCGYAYENNVDDLGFTRHLLDKLSAEYNIDQSKIYFTGFSNGAMFAGRAALNMPDRVAAVAPVASAVGAKFEEDEDHIWLDHSSQPIPVLIMHGREDQSVPFGGGESGYDVLAFTGAYDRINYWLDNNNCVRHPTEISKTDYFTHEIYDQCESSTEVNFYAVNADHVWPGGLMQLSKNLSRRSVDATSIIWNFFSVHQN